MEAGAATNKTDLRAEHGDRRRRVAEEDRRRWSAAIAERIARLPEFAQATRVALYAATPDEVQMTDVFTAARQAGKATYFPRVGAGPRALTFHRVAEWTELHSGHCGILEPRGGDSLDAAALDLVIVPGVAFDRRGHRVGRGAGYYDALLAAVRGCRVGVAFECQLVPAVPAEGHDERVDIVVTERQVVRCG